MDAYPFQNALKQKAEINFFVSQINPKSPNKNKAEI
jgi:hypothetical protein